MEPPVNDQDPFGGIGKEDFVRKPQRLTGKQLLFIAGGIVLMTAGGLLLAMSPFVAEAIISLGDWELNPFRLRRYLAGCGIGMCATGYLVYRRSWAYRRR